MATIFLIFLDHPSYVGFEIELMIPEKNFGFLTPKCERSSLYKSFKYGSSQYNGLNDELENVQKRAARFLLFL